MGAEIIQFDRPRPVALPEVTPFTRFCDARRELAAALAAFMRSGVSLEDVGDELLATENLLRGVCAANREWPSK